MSIRRSATAASLFVLVAVLLPAAPASAAPITYVVNSTADDVDGGGCQPTPDDCTLREAITAANAHAGLDKIQFALGAGVPTIDVDADLPTITDRINLNGNTGGATRIELSGPAGGDGATGLRIAGASASGSVVRRLILNDFGSLGIHVTSNDNTITGNWVGLSATGLADGGGADHGILVSGGDQNRIGGATEGTRNVVSGNVSSGITISEGGNNVLEGNYLGTDKNGAAGPGFENGNSGIFINTSIANHLTRNVVAGSLVGVRVGPDAASNLLFENWIGIDAQGNPGPNQVGVLIGNQVTDTGTTAVSLQSNRIDHNLGLGIDLGDDGVTPNDNADADDGPNEFLNFPVLTRAQVEAEGVRVNGRIRSDPNQLFQIELFVNPACDASGFGEGNESMAIVFVPTDAAGRGTFSVLLGRPKPGEGITATSRRDFIASTSEFSACRTVT